MYLIRHMLISPLTSRPSRSRHKSEQQRCFWIGDGCPLLSPGVCKHRGSLEVSGNVLKLINKTTLFLSAGTDLRDCFGLENQWFKATLFMIKCTAIKECSRVGVGLSIRHVVR